MEFIININIDDVLLSFDELHGIISALDPCLLCPVPRLVLCSRFQIPATAFSSYSYFCSFLDSKS